MAVAFTALTDLPAVGTPMFLALGEGVTFRSRLESVEHDTFTVAAPLETVGGAVPAPGHEFEVFWVPPATRIVLSARLSGISEGLRSRWVLTPLEAPRPSNRREYVRGGGGAAVRLAIDDRVIDGALLDISEGGLRCWIDEPVALAPGDHACVAVGLGASGEAEMCGTVLTVREAPDGDPGEHVVLTFEVEESLAQIIRLYVMTWEINERRLNHEAA